MRFKSFFIAMGLCAALTAATAAEERRPNVLFIISDDLSANALGCYGNDQVRTPHIDELSGQSVVFTRAYCQFPVCGPSRAALMSGMYPQAIGVTGNGSAKRFTDNLGNRPSMAEHFKNHEWRTARISKIYHMRVPGDITAGVDGPDHEASWNERFNCQGPEWMTPGIHESLTNEELRYEPDVHYGLGFGTAFYVVKGASDGIEQPDAQAASKAIEWMRTHRDETFFLAVGLVRPHVPLVAPENFFDAYPPERMPLPVRMEDDWEDIPRAGISRNSRDTGLAGEPDAQRKVLSAYYASVEFMDAQVGKMLRELDRLGLRDDTIVVFTSDHGYHLGEHDFWQKMSLHEESVRIPMMISAPGVEPTPTAALVEQIDLYPTLAALAGLDIPAHCQGKDLAPVLKDPFASVREWAYCYKGNGHLVRTGRWAYMEYERGGAELYDMQSDTGQFRNLADFPIHAEQVQRMKQLLDERLSDLEDFSSRL